MRNNTNINVKTKDLVISGLLIAIVCVSTFIGFNVTGTDGGYAHLGNVTLFMIAIVFGKRKGAIAGAFGMGLFDILSPYAIWAPFTFIIRAIMGYIIGSFAWAKGREGNSILWNFIGIFVSAIWMLIGYYFTEVILYGNWIKAFSSIPGNILQLVVGVTLGLPLAKLIKKYKMFNNL